MENLLEINYNDLVNYLAINKKFFVRKISSNTEEIINGSETEYANIYEFFISKNNIWYFVAMVIRKDSMDIELTNNTNSHLKTIEKSEFDQINVYNSVYFNLYYFIREIILK